MAFNIFLLLYRDELWKEKTQKNYLRYRYDLFNRFKIRLEYYVE